MNIADMPIGHILREWTCKIDGLDFTLEFKEFWMRPGINISCVVKDAQGKPSIELDGALLLDSEGNPVWKTARYDSSINAASTDLNNEHYLKLVAIRYQGQEHRIEKVVLPPRQPELSGDLWG